MLGAVFLAIRRDAKFGIRIGDLGDFAHFANVDRLLAVQRLFKALAALAGSHGLSAVFQECRSEKQQIVTQAHDDHHFHVQWSEE